MWKGRVYSDEEAAAFREALAASPVEAVVIHAIYLLNCASEDRDMRRKSLQSLTASLRSGRAIGAAGVMLHPGSAKTGDTGRAIKRAAAAIREALAESEELSAVPGGHRRRRRDTRSQLRGAGRADRGRRWRATPRRVPGLLPPAGLGL